jgi:UDP-GlcNAc3NAcA epimerase
MNNINKKIKICTIVGARPQFIKAASLSRYITNCPNIKEIIVHTGQHYDNAMSASFFKELTIPSPNHMLSLSSTTRASVIGEMLEKIETVLLLEKPDYVLVYGDTNTTLAGALVANILSIPIIHIEAGMRSFNMNMPEEVNRVLTDHISKILFCSSNVAKQNLIAEGLGNRGLIIENVGDIMYDSMLFYKDILSPDRDIYEVVSNTKNFILVTIHRQENADSEEKLKSIFQAFSNCSDNKFILPLHPRTKKNIEEFRIKIPSNVIILPPLPYSDIIFLLKECSLVVTDSGGLQKEAYFLSKYCVIMRNETEWVELVENNYAVLVGTQSDLLSEQIKKFYKKEKSEIVKNLYGDGNSCKYIIEKLLSI